MAFSAAVAMRVVDPRPRFFRMLESPKVSSSIRSLTVLLPRTARLVRGQEAHNHRGALPRSAPSSQFREGMSDAGRMPGAMFGVKAIKPARASRGAVCARHGAPVVKDCRSDPARLWEKSPIRESAVSTRREHPREALSFGHPGFSVTSVPLRDGILYESHWPGFLGFRS